MDFQEIIAGTVGKENTFGTCVGIIKPEKMSFARFSTDDTAGKMRGYVGEGRFTDDALNTFGGPVLCRNSQLAEVIGTLSARRVSNIMSPLTSRRLRRLFTKLPRVIWAGICTGTVPSAGIARASLRIRQRRISQTLKWVPCFCAQEGLRSRVL